MSMSRSRSRSMSVTDIFMPLCPGPCPGPCPWLTVDWHFFQFGGCFTMFFVQVHVQVHVPDWQLTDIFFNLEAVLQGVSCDPTFGRDFLHVAVVSSTCSQVASLSGSLSGSLSQPALHSVCVWNCSAFCLPSGLKVVLPSQPLPASPKQPQTVPVPATHLNKEALADRVPKNVTCLFN